jgi:hypothetical protein
MVRQRIHSWLSQTHGAQFELVRHFVSSQLVNELTASGQVQRLAITALCVLGCVGPLIVRLYTSKYAYLQSLDTGDLYLAAVRADRLFFIALSMITAGGVTVFQWQRLFPSRLDYLALKVLPVRMHQLFLARFLSSFLITLVVIADLNLATSFLFPFLTSGRWQTPSFGVRYIAAHALATFTAGLFTFFAIGAMQGLLMNLLPPCLFERVSVLLQAVLGTAFVAALPYVVEIPNWHLMIAAQPRWLLLFPPAWFLGWYETLLGSHNRYFLQLREMAGTGMAMALCLAFAMYLLSYHRHARRSLEQASQGPGRRSSVAKAAGVLHPILMQHSQTQAAFVFAIHTLRRSRHHKLVMGVCVAIAAVLALQTAAPAIAAYFRSSQDWSLWQIESILAVPLVVSAVLISSLCYVFQLPSESRASWVFRMAESAARLKLLSSVEFLLVICAVVPGLLLSIPLEVLVVGWVRAFAHTALSAVLLLLLIELRLYEWHKIPFTCSYVAGRRNLWQALGLYLILFTLLIPTIAYFEARLLSPFLLLGAAAVLGVIYFFLRSARRMQWGIVPLLFDEFDEPLIAGMKLNRE